MKSLTQHIDESFLLEGFSQSKKISKHPHPSTEDIKASKDIKYFDELFSKVTNLQVYHSPSDDDETEYDIFFNEQKSGDDEVSVHYIEGKGFSVIDNSKGKLILNYTYDINKVLKYSKK